MRTSEQLTDLVVSKARADSRIRGIYLTGSRVNPGIPEDIFQDYDLVYAVTETASFIACPEWVDVFGPRLRIQLPNESGRMAGEVTDFENHYGYLMQLADGNRIDLHIQSVSYCIELLKNGRPYRVLLDKDGLFPESCRLPGTRYDVCKPSAVLYRRCCNEFWWSLHNVAKGLWRRQIPYAMDKINFHVRPQLVTMLSWYAGEKNGFSVSVGKNGKYLDKFLPGPVWKQFLATYPRGRTDDMWEAVFIMCSLFDRIARETGDALQYEYNTEEARGSISFLETVRRLPPDAKEIFPREG